MLISSPSGGKVVAAAMRDHCVDGSVVRIVLYNYVLFKYFQFSLWRVAKELLVPTERCPSVGK